MDTLEGPVEMEGASPTVTETVFVAVQLPSTPVIVYMYVPGAVGVTVVTDGLRLPEVPPPPMPLPDTGDAVQVRAYVFVLPV